MIDCVAILLSDKVVFLTSILCVKWINCTATILLHKYNLQNACIDKLESVTYRFSVIHVKFSADTSNEISTSLIINHLYCNNQVINKGS